MKWGLGDSYDNVSFISKKTRAYLDITKPASTVGVAGGFTAAVVFHLLFTNQAGLIADEASVIISAAIAVGLSHGASQAMNMAEDAEMDRNTPHKQNRPIPAGVISEEEARSISWFLILAALVRAFSVNNRFGSVLAVLVFMGVFYNLNPIRAKERVFSIPWQAVSRGLLMFPAAWSVFGNPLAPEAWALGLFMFWYVFGFQNSADIIDRDIDEEYGIKTFAVMYGVDGVAVIASGASMMMMATVLISIHLSILPERMIALLGIMPFCAVMLYHMAFNPGRVSDSTGNHPAWLWFYIGMVLTVVLPLAVELF